MENITLSIVFLCITWIAGFITGKYNEKTRQTRMNIKALQNNHITTRTLNASGTCETTAEFCDECGSQLTQPKTDC